MQTIKTFSIFTYLVSIQPWNYRYMFAIRICIAKLNVSTPFTNAHRCSNRFLVVVVVGVSVLHASVNRVQNQKRLSQGENCKHVNKSINSIFYGRFDVLTRCPYYYCYYYYDFYMLEKVWFRFSEINKNPHNFNRSHI